MSRTIIYDSNYNDITDEEIKHREETNKDNKADEDEAATKVINAVNSANAKLNNDFTRPNHYCYSSIEPKDAIRTWGLNFNLGNVIKYVARAGHKAGESKISDLQKAKTYINFEIDALIEESKKYKDEDNIQSEQKE